MNVGVIGWWNNGNQGDFAILDSVTQALLPHRVVPIDVPFHASPDEIARLNQLDFLIFGGGGLLTSSPAVPFDSFDRWGNDLQVPIGVIGLGVDEVKPEYQRAVRQLLDRAAFVYVRDTTSQRLLNHPKVQLMPDVTFFQPQCAQPHPFNATQPVCGVNLRSLAPADRQHWIAVLQSLPVQLRGVPLATYSAFEELEILRSLDPQVSGAFDYDLYQSLDLMIGTAFHAVIFAIQAGVPIIAVSYAPKVERLMIELGLQEFLLKTDDWSQLPAVVERLRSQHEQIAARLRHITAQLAQRTQQIMADVKRAIENAAPRRETAKPRVSIVLGAAEATAATRLTLEACRTQTYPNVEIIVVSAGTFTDESVDKHVTCPAGASLTQQINLGFAQASGDYLTWITAGDRYTLDAIAVMVDRLQTESECAATYADFYTVSEPRLIAHAHAVDEPGKLVRRNVVGPCFLFRRTLHGKLNGLDEQAALPDYDFWLRAHQADRLRPIHARLMFCRNPSGRSDVQAEEQLTRRRWRAAQPWLKRKIGDTADTAVVESWVIQPLLKLRRHLRAAR